MTGWDTRPSKTLPNDDVADMPGKGKERKSESNVNSYSCDALQCQILCEMLACIHAFLSWLKGEEFDFGQLSASISGDSASLSGSCHSLSNSASKSSSKAPSCCSPSAAFCMLDLNHLFMARARRRRADR